MRLQIATSSKKHGGRRYPPYAFTEHGAIMAATVLNSERAIKMSVFMVRAFVRMREMLAKNRLLAAKIDEFATTWKPTAPRFRTSSRPSRNSSVPEGPSKRKIGFQLPPGKEINAFRGRVARGYMGSGHTCANNYLRRWRYRVPSTCFAMVSTSSVTSRNFATISAVCFGSCKTA